MTPSSQVAATLRSILEMEGLHPLKEPQRVRGLLTDHTPQQPAREREVLFRALQSPIFERAWQARERGTSVSLMGLAQWLADEHGYAAELCHWGVETWTLALGLHPPSTQPTSQPPLPTAAGDQASDSPRAPQAQPPPASNESIVTPSPVPPQLPPPLPIPVPSPVRGDWTLLWKFIGLGLAIWFVGSVIFDQYYKYMSKAASQSISANPPEQERVGSPQTPSAEQEKLDKAEKVSKAIVVPKQAVPSPSPIPQNSADQSPSYVLKNDLDSQLSIKLHRRANPDRELANPSSSTISPTDQPPDIRFISPAQAAPPSVLQNNFPNPGLKRIFGDLTDNARLIFSASRGDVNAVRSLISRGADVNTVNGDRKTPLHASADKGHLKIVDLLLKSGADVKVRDAESHTPYFYAEKNGHHDVAQLLQIEEAWPREQSPASNSRTNNTDLVELREFGEVVTKTLKRADLADIYAVVEYGWGKNPRLVLISQKHISQTDYKKAWDIIRKGFDPDKVSLLTDQISTEHLD